MKKRIVSLLLAVLLLLTVLPVSVSAAVTSLSQVAFTVNANTDAGLSGKVTVAFTRSNSAYAGTLYLPGCADTAALTLSWEEGVSVKQNGTPCISGETPVPAKDESLTYAVTVGNSTANFTVTTMQGSVGVEAMFINIDETLGTISAMNRDSQHETACFGSATVGGETNYISMKGRGNTTWSDFDKKPYNITFFKKSDFEEKKKVELIDGTKTKKWSILANAKDPTGLRNKVGYDIAEELGIGLPSKSIDVWMNGEYIGNYLLTPKNDYQAPDDGYMVEIDNKTDVDQFTLTNSPKFTVKEMADGLTVEDVKNSVSKAWDALRQSNSDEYLDYFDLDSWAKMYLLNELYKDIDVSVGSIFFTKATMDDDTGLVAGPVWDLDGTLGRVGQSYINVDKTYEKTGSGWYIDGIGDYTAPFFQLLGKHESFMKRVYEIYNENKAALEGILSDLDTQSALIAASAEMNYVRWPQYMTNTEHFSVSKDNTKYGSDAYAVIYQKTDSWTAYTNNLKEYITKRLLFFSDSLTVEPPADGGILGETTVVFGETLTLTANTAADGYQWQLSADGKTWTDIAGATAKTYTTAPLYTMNGCQIRCVAKKNGAIISTTRVAAVATGAVTYLSPVTVTVTLDGHEHDYQETVIPPTCTERGYTVYTCYCGDSYEDAYTDALGHAYVNGKCTRCGEKDPDHIPCIVKTSTALTNGTLLFTLGGQELGEYTFASTGNNGWTIAGTDGRYLSQSNGTLTYATSPYTWTYSNGKFSVSGGWGGFFNWGNRTTYYLVCRDKKLMVSTDLSDSNTSFAVYTENEAHAFTAWEGNGDGQHAHTCSVCGLTETGACTYGENGICTACGDKSPSSGDVDGNGAVNSDDAVYLLRHTLSPTEYPVSINGDVDGNGAINSDDAVYLLRHTLSPESYPLYPER